MSDNQIAELEDAFSNVILAISVLDAVRFNLEDTKENRLVNNALAGVSSLFTFSCDVVSDVIEDMKGTP